MKYKSLLTHLSLTPLVFLCAMVSAADAQPACRSITNPSPGSVCYTEWQFSSRQRGEGGTKTHEQLVERVEPNYVIVDTEVIVQEKNGITSNPSPNIVSSSGNASIVNETSSSIRELTEVKNSLQAKAAGCYPPVCGQVQNQLDAVNQKISEYSERKRVAIEAGGNEKILFKWTTKVECSKLGICGSGAWMNGKIKVYQRYLGNPSAIRQESLSLVGSSQVIIRSAVIPPSGNQNNAKSPVFDADFYLTTYADLRNAFGTNQGAALNHWLTNGIKEGRTSSPAFDVRYYLGQHPDLQNAFGSSNYSAAVNHWLTYGIKEGRKSHIIFDVRYYLGIYPDLRNAFGSSNYSAAINHWLTNGVKEGRRGSSQFDPKFYLSNNPDVAKAYGSNNYKGAIEHYLKYGIKEGRRGSR